MHTDSHQLKPGQQVADVPEELAHSRSLSAKYLIYLPEDYETTGDRRYPLLVFLHGRGMSGEDPEELESHGPPMLVARESRQFPCIILSPQCRTDWDSGELMTLIGHVESITRVDSGRIYLTGFSMGGDGAWDLAASCPDKFAAVVPMCGVGDPTWAHMMKDLPVWVFHGAMDDVVGIEHAQAMVAALRKHGSRVKFTVYPAAGHDCWTETYSNQEVYEWMFRQKSPRVDPSAPGFKISSSSPPSSAISPGS